MKNFRVLNIVAGWVAFAIAAITYLLTIEASASFWDCGEFIASAYKLDVGHPPGAPFFMLTGKFFSLFASSPAQVAVMVNSMSAILSALTILFLYFTISHLAQKIVGKSEENYSLGNVVVIIGSGLVGALAYTFSDTFWFSAVEGEVYAYSSFFTALVFWLILKWEKNADRVGSDRWLILIAYLMGLSIGVHLLNLLAIPAIVLVYYYKKYTPSLRGFIYAILTSFAILAFVLYGLVPGIVSWAARFELLFVNTLGMSYNTGLFFYLLLVLVTLVWALFESYTNKSYIRTVISYILAVSLVGIPFLGDSIIVGIVVIALLAFYLFKKKEDRTNVRWLNTSLAMIAVMIIGYSSYSVIMIRSAAQPTMDQNSPDNVFALKYYLNREQYGDRPLLYGPTYNAPPKLVIKGNSCEYDLEKNPMYAPKPKEKASEKDEYVVAGYRYDQKKDSKFMMLFPRMYSRTPSHVSAYKVWGDITGTKVNYDFCGEQKSEMKPTFIENLRFFFSYQVNFMYWRYFMWNFSGRQNDIQSFGEIEHGNWITGIGFIDNLLVGDQQYLPTELKENKGRNTYFLLPLILGLIGIFFSLNSGKKGNQAFVLTLMLFLMTGLAIVVYLNQTPYQPRERDYAYAGSFYAFCIWIGLGVMGVYKILSKIMPKNAGAVLATVACLGIPVLMAAQNWDDHDRSGRTTARDFGQNYLNSTEPNAILFSNGDNDTFPLWYNQEVEGVRTDVRVCNLSYLPTDWYINQMKRGSYDSKGLPISWHEKDYISGKNDVLPAQNLLEGKALDMRTAFDFIKSDDPTTKIDGDGYFPTTQLFLPIDANHVIKTGTLAEKDRENILPEMTFNLPRNVYKGEAMVMEMIKENNWERPMYVCVTVGSDYYPKSLDKYFRRTGLAMQIVPMGQKDSLTMNVDTERMYDNMMNKFKFGGIDREKIYLDDNILRMCQTHRIQFSYLVEALLAEGDSVRAKKALEYCDKVIPARNVPYDFSSNMLAAYYYELGMKADGDRILTAVADNSVEYLKWYASLTPTQQAVSANSINRNLAIINQVMQISQEYKSKEVFNKYAQQFDQFLATFNMRR